MEEEFKVARLRQAVSAVVFSGSRFFMMSGVDWPEGSWCFPQGGLKLGETHREAVRRELVEELGTDKFEILGKSVFDHSYLFPNEIKKKKGCDGQYQTIWLVEFLGDPEEIKINDVEIMQHRWFGENEVILNMRYPEQKEIFTKVLEELKKLREGKIL
ncbi:MAG: NUDIX domain-containing protein [Nanoarchaeota archaeon]